MEEVSYMMQMANCCGLRLTVMATPLICVLKVDIEVDSMVLVQILQKLVHIPWAMRSIVFCSCFSIWILFDSCF